AQHDKWRCGFNRTYKMMSATKVAPPTTCRITKDFNCHCERKRSNQTYLVTPHCRLPRVRTNARNDI
ncbi:MAG: hypothetical protein K2N54_05525, partial [Helicobacter sp.]|nr:hypothetical protein [Helicobacter sp.]